MFVEIEGVSGNKSKIEVDRKSWQLAFQLSNQWVEENFTVFGGVITKTDEPFKPKKSDFEMPKGVRLNPAYDKFVDLIFSWHPKQP
jgi:hypothetical protein